MKKQICKTNSVEQTVALGEALGATLRGGEVFECRSDLGGGKTTLVRGIAAGAGSRDPVSSPSFMLCNTYQTGSNMQLSHFDFYRLSEPGIMRNELTEVVNDPDAVVLVEWADIVESVLPAQHATILIESVGDTARRITVSVPDGQVYLLEGLSEWSE